MKWFTSLGHAWNGLKTAWKEEANLRIHTGVLLLVCCAGVYFEIEELEWIVIILCSLIVIVLELINSSIEALADAVTGEHHPLLGKAKDISAAAVLVSAVGAVVVGGIIFGKYIVNSFS